MRDSNKGPKNLVNSNAIDMELDIGTLEDPVQSHYIKKEVVSNNAAEPLEIEIDVEDDYSEDYEEDEINH